ncbi:MAG: GNAT family N-acetyltransferase [Pseudomonadota bacterium]
MPVFHVRWLTAADAGRMARLERRVYSARQRSGRQYMRSLLAEMDAAGDNFSMGLFRNDSLVAYLLTYRVADRRTPFDEFELDPVTESLPGASVYVEDVVFTPYAGRHGYYFFRAWMHAIRARAPGLPLDAFCQQDALAMWQRHDRGFRLCRYYRQEPVEVNDRETGETWYWVSWLTDWTPQHEIACPPGVLPGRIAALDDTAPYQVRWLQTRRQFAELTAHWRDLLQRVPDASVFATPELLQAWWQVHGYRSQLALATAWHEDTLVGVAPWMIAPVRFYGRYLQQFGFIGDNSSVDSPTVVTAPGHEAAAGALWRAARSLSSQWDSALLQEQQSSAGLATLGPADAPLLRRESAALSAAIVDTTAPWPDYLATRSKSLRKNLRRKRKRLGDDASFELLQVTAADDAAAALQRFLAVEARSWKWAAGEALGTKAEALRYYRTLLERLPRGCALQLATLSRAGADIAASLALVYRGTAYGLEVCHDQGFDDLSPGVLLTAFELERCCADTAIERYDFLTGVPENKAQWSTATRISRDLYLLPADLRGRLTAAIAFRWRPALKRVLVRLGLQERALAVMERIRKRRGAA